MASFRTAYIPTILILIAHSPGIHAEFLLNFQPQDTSFGDHARSDTRCNRPEGANLGCSGSYSHVDTTPFLQELFYDDATGLSYFHVIVGKPEDGFAQEVFIKANGPTWEGGLGSASLGDGTCRSGGSFVLSGCNLGDPLGESHDNTFTGIGSGNPKAVVMRQVMGGTWNETTKTWSCGTSNEFCMEFLKDDYLLKPVITQTIHDIPSDMTAFFEFDMRNSDYDTNSIAGTMTNTVTFSDPSLGTKGDFNYATDKDVTALSGGRYIFTGTGPTGASAEPYEYWDSDFQLDRDWTIFKQ